MDNVINRDTLVRAFELYSGSLAESYPEAVFEPSEKFERQMRKLIKSEKSVYHRLTLTKARRALAIAAVIAALLAATMSVSAIRERIFSFFVTRGPQVDVTEYAEENAPSAAAKLDKTLEPAYLPEGYALEDSSADEESSYLLYSDGESFITIEQFAKSAYKSATDGEYKTEKRVAFDGVEYIVRTSDDGATLLVWEKGDCVFELLGFISEDELIKTASSLS